MGYVRDRKRDNGSGEEVVKRDEWGEVNMMNNSLNDMFL